MSTNHSEIRELEFENARFLPEVIRFLDEGHTVTLGLKGYSMRPFLEHKRDKALLSRPTTLQKGDAVLAEIAPGVFVLHRIVKIEGDDITLRGDGNLAIERCKKTDVKGFALGFYRKPTVLNGAFIRPYGQPCCRCVDICWLFTHEFGYVCLAQSKGTNVRKHSIMDYEKKSRI